MFSNKLLSIIVPVYNEESVLEEFHNRVSVVLHRNGLDAEFIYVNDGSTDRSLELMYEMKELDERIAIVDLSRNFGKEIAMAAGLDYVNGEAAVIIDADLQDPPELIPVLMNEWEKGYDVVYAKRTVRNGETWIKKTTAHFFYRFMKKIGSISIPEDTGDYRLLSRRAVEALKELRERQRFSKGLFAWIGYPQKAVLYEREPRAAGTSKWNYVKLWNLAVEGITSFSIVPLKLATGIGSLTAVSAFIYICFVIFKTLFVGERVQGYPSLMVAILFLGGIQLICLGIIGEYLGRVFNETKQRPLYLVNRYVPSLRAFVKNE